MLGKATHVTMGFRSVYVCILLYSIARFSCHSQQIMTQEKSGVHYHSETNFLDSTPFSYITPKNKDVDIPLILWWTGRLFGDRGLLQLRCPSAVCYSTSDRMYFNDPRAYGVYFYGTDLDPEDMPLPRKPHHEWALYHEESPMNNYMLVHKTMMQLFNHTATFRRESDYPITSYSLSNTEYLIERKPVSIEEKNKARKEGYSPVLFLQSHCNTASDRERYVKELMKYIPVDSYGACLHNRDLPEHLRDPVETMESSSLYDLISKYKFHLAFENAVCKDYMTEKLFRPLHVGSVPVYRGSSKARDFMPDNHSVIMVDDFSDPKQLAEFLINLDNDDEAYSKYLNYKTNGISNPYLLKHLNEREWAPNHRENPDSLIGFECYLCTKLNERYNIEKLHRSNSDIPLLSHKTADEKHLGCPQPHPSVGTIDDVPADDEWLNSFWVEDYWGSLDKAQAIMEMIEKQEKDPSSFMIYWDRISQQRPINPEMIHRL